MSDKVIPSFCPLFPPRTCKGISGLQIHVIMSLLFLFIYLFLAACTAHRILVVRPEIKPVPPAVEVQRKSHHGVFLTGGREAVCQGAESPQGFTEQMGLVWVSWGG